jgi:exonuclease SbcC
MSLEEHRMHLEEGVACPLCLSDKHGFKKGDIPVDFNSQFNREEQKLNRLEEIAVNLDKKSKDLLNDISYYLHQLKTLSDKEVAQLKDLDEVQTKTIKLFLDYPMLEQEMLDYDSDTLQEEKKSWQDRNSLLETIKSKLTTLQKDEIAKQEKLSAAKSRIEIFEKEIDELLIQKREKDAQLLVLSATGETQLPQINALLKDLNTTVASLEELQKAIKEIEKRKKLYEDALKKVQKVEQDLAELNAKIATQNSLLQNQQEQIAAKQDKSLTETTVLSDLKMKRAELFEDKNPQEEQRRRREALEHLRTEAENLKNNKNALSSDLQANNKLLEDKVQTETQKQKEDAARGAELIEKAKQIGFDSLEQLRLAMLPEEDARRWKQEKEEIEKRWEKNNELLLQYSAAYNESAEKRPTELSLEEIQAAKKVADEARDAAIQAIGKIEQKLEVHFANETRQKEFAAQISLQTKEHNRWQQLYELIGHAEGKKFRKFAQNITLSKLIELANKHLQHFASGRYLLEKRGDDDLEIDILDAYQANNRRILSTLSGGETFLASLSLALGLSDLAGGRANIESLFIDEGFGTLDAETLNIALSALQMLQNQGKTIGIISHVQQLQNAIDVQIKVQSKSGGFSELIY